MLNLQQREPKIEITGELNVVKVWETIQGEGPFAGLPAVFVRLAGCNYQCPLCDTDYTSTRRMISDGILLRQIKELRAPDKDAYGRTLIVLTGGEPFRQNFISFARAAIAEGYEVQVETNGSIYRDIMRLDEDDGPDREIDIVCSPKGKVHPKMWPQIGWLKYVVEHGNVSCDGLPTSTLQNPFGVDRPPKTWQGQIFIQPLDEQDAERNKLHMAQAVKSCMEHGYTLCLQVHKIAGLE